MSSGSIRLPSIRYIVVALAVILTTHFIVSLSSPTYASNTSLEAVKSRFPTSNWATNTNGGTGRVDKSGHDQRIQQLTDIERNRIKDSKLPSVNTTSTRRANAAFVILARNSDLWEILFSIRGMEDRFNKNYNYPYVFLNDELFTEDFKKRTSALASGPCTYGLIPEHQWKEPSWIDGDKAANARAAMEKDNVIYGGSETYRRMCRYQSGLFFEHPLLDSFKYYWRIEPSVKYFCDISYDPFLYMQDNKKKYGWVVSLYEYGSTIATLWDETKKFIGDNPQYLAQPNLLDFLSDDGGETYNLCHFWSNFEIADLDLWRSDAYRAYFKHLDEAGGFSYERWGDAPVHSIAAALFLKPEEFHYFSDMGYRHEPFQHCPTNRPDACSCNPQDGNNFETHGYSCTPRYKKITNWKPTSEETKFIEL